MKTTRDYTSSNLREEKKEDEKTTDDLNTQHKRVFSSDILILIYWSTGALEHLSQGSEQVPLLAIYSARSFRFCSQEHSLLASALII